MEEWTCECTLERGRTRDAVEVTDVRENCQGCGGWGGEGSMFLVNRADKVKYSGA